MNVDFSFCLIFNKEAQFLWNRIDFSWNTSFRLKAISVGLGKACVPWKICSVSEKLSFFIITVVVVYFLPKIALKRFTLLKFLHFHWTPAVAILYSLLHSSTINNSTFSFIRAFIKIWFQKRSIIVSQPNITAHQYVI